MCQTPEQIADSNLTIQEIDDYLDRNELSAQEKLMLRVMRHNMITGIQIQQDIQPISKALDDTKKNPSLLYKFRHDTGKVIAGWMFVFGATYVVYRFLEIIVGLEAIITSAFGL